MEYFVGRLSGNVTAGIETLQASLDADFNHADRHHFVGALHASAGQICDAVRSWSGATTADPSFVDAYIELVNLHEEQGDFEAARAVASQAVRSGVYWADEWQRPELFIRGLASRPVWSPKRFAWVKDLEAVYEEIKDELLHFLSPQTDLEASNGDAQLQGWSTIGSTETDSHDSELVSSGGSWRLIALFGDYDEQSMIARQAFPRTVAHLERIVPDAIEMARTGLGEVLISALAPGTRLKPHCVQNNLRLTCHLGLFCPEGARLRVGPRWTEWQEGRCLLFDDSYEHEVWNDGEGLRIVLLLRFWHPDFPENLRAEAPELDEMAQYDLSRRYWIPPMELERSKAVKELVDCQVGSGLATDEINTIHDFLTGPT